MGERVTDDRDLTAERPGPEIRRSPTRTDLVAYTRASGDFEPFGSAKRTGPGETVAVRP